MASLLDKCPGGNLLEKAEPITSDSGTTVEELRQRILADCLPAQRDFINDEKHRIVGYVGGFGSGKSYALARKVLTLGLQNPGETLMVCEPSFPMIRTVFIPAMDQALDNYDIEYSFRISPQPEYDIRLPNGTIKVLCQSASNFEKIRGQNICCALWDEADTLPAETAQKCGEMLLARMRSGKLNQLALASTPEGFRYCYRTFIEQKGPDKRLIRVKTKDNPNLPKGFIDSLERNFPSNLLTAYLEGHFVNMASCSIYPEFDRSLHYTDARPSPEDTIFVGIDLNVGNCVTQHLLRKGDEFHFFSEKVYRDTQQIAAGLKDLYPDHFRRGQLVLIPDAASKQRSTAAAQESDLGILKNAGHTVNPQRSNPIVQDRINAVNALIEKGRIRVGNDCKHLIRTLEQHAYDDKGKPEKGGVGMDDLSHAGDAMGYAVYRLAAIRQWRTGSTKARIAQLW